MTKFIIPNIYKRGFDIFLSLDRDFVDSFIAEVEKAPGGLLPHELSVSLSKELNFAESDLEELISMLFSLYRAKEGSRVGLDDFVDGILSAVEQTEDLKLKINEDTRELLVKVLNISGSFLLTHKAIDVVRERERFLLNARIITDARPIFSEDNELLGSVIIHTLRIAYQEGEEIKELHFALDKNDLSLLKENLQKAESEEDVIRKKFSSDENVFIEVK